MATAVTKNEIMNLLYDDPVEVGHWVGFDKLTDLHNEWLKMFLYGDEDLTLQGHRGSYKSTCLSLYFAIHLLEHPSETIIYFRKTETDASDILRQTKKIILSGAFQKMTKILYGQPMKLTKESATELDTNFHTGSGGQSVLKSSSIGGSVTGMHSELIFCDDIVTVKDRISAAERRATAMAFQEIQNLKNRGGRLVLIGTPWHKDDAFKLAKEPVKYDVYSTGLVSDEEIKALRNSMSPSLFAANYELKHIADTEALFSEPLWYEGEETDICDGKAHIDAAYGGSDYTAYTVMKKLPDGKIIATGRMWQKHIDDCLPTIGELNEKYKAAPTYCEDNGDKGYLKKELEERGIPAKNYHESTNKYIKISSFLKQNWNNIYWLSDTDPEYLAQILDYNEHSEHDDAPDSAASLVRLLIGGTMAKVNTYSYLRGGL